MNSFPKDATAKKLEDLEEDIFKIQSRFEAIDLPNSIGVDQYLKSCLKANLEGAIENVRDIIEQVKYLE